ncbi:type II 3-dehydroquinate dehydratase [Desulfoluna sp.]|uniref:type II 3-dehydroquinate dehydratase n=1 Tax=Desulfoluna sp. TaxID=2045199 RepID=UPI0026075F03|nr:type II 3-dehydroquinate dehydratase [Desulfoluna sp.]
MVIDVIHGPNLNMLGRREPEIYGTTTLADIDRELMEYGTSQGADIESFQSNTEGEIVDRIQEAFGRVSGVIINPAAYTHTSVAIRDALAMLSCPVVEIHLSNIHKREPFRHHSYISGVADGVIAGFGARGYLMALQAILEMIRK